MANVKITELTAYTNPASTDVVPIVDLVNDQTKKVTLANIFQNFPDGTEATPSIAFDGDNTGIYRPGADQIALATNGTGRLFVDADGNVGVGTTPEEILHIKGASEAPNTRDGVMLQHSTAASTADTGLPIVWSGYISSANQNYGLASICGRKENGTDGNAAGYLQFATGDSSGSVTEKARIDSSGRVGIGTTSVSQLLHLARSGGSTIFELQRTDSNTTGTVGAISFTASDGHSVAAINAAGDGDNEGAHLIFRTTSAASANNYFNSTSERMRIDSSGNVGVGTTSPERALSIRANNAMLQIEGSGGNGRQWSLASVDDASGAALGPSGNFAIYDDSSGGGTRLSIDSSGNVGIGVTSPDAPLRVTESAVAQNSQTNDIAVFERNDAGFLKIYSPNNNTGGVAFGDPDDNFIGAVRYDHNDDNLNFYVNNDERVRIDSSGRLLVGTSSSVGVPAFLGNYTSPQETLLQVAGNTVTTASFSIRNYQDRNDSTATIALAKSRSGTAGSFDTNALSNNSQIGAIVFSGDDGDNKFVASAAIIGEVDGTAGADDMPGRLVFSTTADGSASPTERMRITSDAYVRLASGTGGIQFNGDTAAANALDDYEEGTFTPAYEPETNSFTSVTYQDQAGSYTKIGNRVFFQGRIRTSAITVGTASGNVSISGLPFTSVNDSANGRNAGSISFASGFGGDTPSALYVEINATEFFLYYRATSNGPTASLDVSDLATGATSNALFFSGCYTVA